jgi:hypothetical protein
MKKVSCVLVAAIWVLVVNAQYEKEESDEKVNGFKKENLFTGGSLTASFYSGGTVLGLSPYFGYSINKFIDVAVSVNFNYTSQRDLYYYGDKTKQTVWGPGAFVRLFPIKFIFAQAQYEYNFLKVKYFPPANSGLQKDIYSVKAFSFLVGGGYCNGREGTGDMFYYFSVLWDVKKDINSPYTDGLGRTIPIIRGGLQIPLFQGGGRHKN